MNKYTCRISLTLLGPFLTAATNPQSYGLDKSFHRDHLGRPVIPASHVKGKLRMALEELWEFIEPDQAVSIEWLFGQPSAENSYEPRPGGLKFSDFSIQAALEEEGQKKLLLRQRTRTTIDPVSGTAAEYMLRTFEDRFPSGMEITCQGEITFFARTSEEAQKIANMLRLGFIWLANLGSEKGVGFGRLKAVKVDDPLASNKAVQATQGSDSLDIRIQPQEPIAVGGVQKRRTNYAEAGQVLPGSAIKGALATRLNQAFGVEPIHRELSKANAGDYTGFEKLAEYFSAIRLTHAFPAHQGAPRPVKMPITVVHIDEEEWDVALASSDVPMHAGRAPAYFIDWKEPQEYFGAAMPEQIHVTHTEIDDHSRRSLQGNLFTETYLSPLDAQGRAVEWICKADFRGIADAAERRQVSLEFARAMQLYFDGLGRENRRVRVSVASREEPAAILSNDLLVDGLALLSLQSDAIMLDPEAVRRLQPWDDLHNLYAAFWHEISMGQGSSPCLELVDFFAHQSFKGGYLYHRYLGQVERQARPNHYRPYYLTNAGSLFKLRARDEKAARKCLEKWLQQGLDLPAWAREEYGQYGGDLWQACPFVPENGYGEVTVNLRWHWDKRL